MSPARTPIRTLFCVTTLTGLLAEILAGCWPGTSPVESCADSLSGVWRGQGRSPGGEPWRFHIVDRDHATAPGQHLAILIYPMFDDGVPPDGGKNASEVEYSPAMFELERHGPAILGTRTYRATRQGTICTVSHQAAIRSCRNNHLRLAWVPTASIDWPACQVLSASRWTTIDLERE